MQEEDSANVRVHPGASRNAETHFASSRELKVTQFLVSESLVDTSDSRTEHPCAGVNENCTTLVEPPKNTET